MRTRLQIAKTKTCAVVKAQRRESAVNSQRGRLDKARCGSGSETVGSVDCSQEGTGGSGWDRVR